MHTDTHNRQEVEASNLAQKPKPRSVPADPLLILAPPCTFSWIVCAMIGQHPQMYGLPELHLFSADTIGEWLEQCSRESYEMDHGLVRTVAELFFGAQT